MVVYHVDSTTTVLLSQSCNIEETTAAQAETCRDTEKSDFLNPCNKRIISIFICYAQKNKKSL